MGDIERFRLVSSLVVRIIPATSAGSVRSLSGARPELCRSGPPRSPFDTLSKDEREWKGIYEHCDCAGNHDQMKNVASLLPQLLLLSGATALLLWHWARGNRRDATAASQAISERSFVLASFASLFLELLLIRWISSELRIFAYLKNFVLIACFLGFGFGAYLSRRRVQMLIPVWSCLALAGVTWLARRQPISLFNWISEVMGDFEDVTMMGKIVWLRGADHVTALALSCVAVACTFLLITLWPSFRSARSSDGILTPRPTPFGRIPSMSPPAYSGSGRLRCWLSSQRHPGPGS